MVSAATSQLFFSSSPPTRATLLSVRFSESIQVRWITFSVRASTPIQSTRSARFPPSRRRPP
jgi:hypothetical protein